MEQKKNPLYYHSSEEIEVEEVMNNVYDVLFFSIVEVNDEDRIRVDISDSKYFLLDELTHKPTRNIDELEYWNSRILSVSVAVHTEFFLFVSKNARKKCKSFTVQHISGKSNVVADAFSRIHIEVIKNMKIEKVDIDINVTNRSMNRTKEQVKTSVTNKHCILYKQMNQFSYIMLMLIIILRLA